MISCRYNPGGVFKISNDIMDNPGDAKYGMTTEQIFEAFKILKEKGAEEFGIHAFLASNTVTNEYYPMLAKEMFEMAVKLQKETGAHVKFINLSGGVGIAYKPDQTPNDIREIGEGVRKVYEEVLVPAGMGDVAIYTEMGRFMMGPYGCLVTKAIHEKHTHKEYIGVDACAVNLMRPAMYGAYHHITVMGKEDQPCDHMYDVTGGLCENNDKFAIDRMLPKIDIGDYVVISMGTDSGAALDEMLRTEEKVIEYRTEPVVWGDKSNLKDVDGKELEAKNSVVYQAVEDSRLKFFGKNNEQITEIEPGHAYATGDFMEKNHLKPGDQITITHHSVSFSVTLDGMAKDALLGSSMMGNSRFLFNKAEIEQLLSDDSIRNGYQGQICYIDLADDTSLSDIASLIAGVPEIMFSGTRSMIKMCYVLDMIVAFTMLVLSICLILVSFVVLKFSITFTISEEFREIGVMKAIGITNNKIRELYIVKYLAISVIGASIGFVLSFPFSKLLICLLYTSPSPRD